MTKHDEDLMKDLAAALLASGKAPSYFTWERFDHDQRNCPRCQTEAMNLVRPILDRLFELGWKPPMRPSEIVVNIQPAPRAEDWYRR